MDFRRRQRQARWWKVPLASLLLVLTALVPAVLASPSCTMSSSTMACCGVSNGVSEAGASHGTISRSCHCPSANWSTTEWAEARKGVLSAASAGEMPLFVAVALPMPRQIRELPQLRSFDSSPPPSRVAIHLRNLSIRC